MLLWLLMQVVRRPAWRTLLTRREQGAMLSIAMMLIQTTEQLDQVKASRSCRPYICFFHRTTPIRNARGESSRRAAENRPDESKRQQVPGRFHHRRADAILRP